MLVASVTPTRAVSQERWPQYGSESRREGRLDGGDEECRRSQEVQLREAGPKGWYKIWGGFAKVWPLPPF